MDNMINKCLELLIKIDLDTKDKENLITSMCLIVTMINLILGKNNYGFTKNSKFGKDLFQFMVITSNENIELNKELINLFKSIVIKFNKAIWSIIDRKDAIRIDGRYTLKRIINFMRNNIEIYLKEIKLNNPTAIDEAKDIIANMHNLVITKERTDFFNNELIPYLRENAEELSESISYYLDEIFNTKSEIKEGSDDYEFFMKGLTSYANETLIDLIRLHDDNRLELSDVVGAIYDLVRLVGSHINNKKESLIHKDL